MAEIAGVTFVLTDYSADPTDPRIMYVPDPIVEATVQDLTDTLSARQADLDNLVYDQFLDGPGTAGKQDLGGGTLVGLTTTTNNMLVGFEARKGSAETGTVTTGDANGVTLNDSSATFQSAGVTPGAWVMNLADGSLCSVLRVVSEQQLITDGLGDGVDDQFAFGDAYEVRLVIQMNIAGGNLVAVDDIGDPREVVLPTAGTQVIRTSAASATLQELASIQFSSFDGGVWVDTGSANSGTTFPTGTPQAPVDNITDALTIALIRGLNTVFLLSDLTLGAGVDVSMMQLCGAAPGLTLTVDTAAVVDHALIKDLTVTGVVDSFCQLRSCVLSTVSALNGALIQDCQLVGTLSFTGANASTLLGCVDGTAGSTNAILDLTGLTSALAIRGWFGGLEIRNKTDAAAVSIDLDGGQVTLDASVTNGAFRFAGIGELVDNSTGTTIAADSLISNPSFVTELLTSTLPSAPTVDSVGETLAVLMAVMGKSRVFQDNFVYDGNGFLTSCRIRVFATSAAAQAATLGGSGEGEIFTTTITGTPDATQVQLPATVLGAT